MACKFNVLGNCIPGKHYMIDASEKLKRIQAMVDEGLYFTINRARQYGKTTTLDLLETRLKGLGYQVGYLSFEGLDDGSFATPKSFCHMFMGKMRKYLEDDLWMNEAVESFDQLGEHMEKMCFGKKIVVFIDEVDKISNNLIFLYFLGLLRSKYLKREKFATFHSVILAGVVDIKNIKYQMAVSGTAVLGANEGSHNSPWNIAASFEVDMSFSPAEISTMLEAYEQDHQTGMDITGISQEIYDYTSGYPFLVSRICQHIDEKLDKNWTHGGIQDAVKIMIKEDNTLFDDIYKNMANNPDLYRLLYDLLIAGKTRTFAHGSLPVKLGLMYGMINEVEGGVAISNKIFESVICNTFIADDEIKNPQKQITGVLKEDVISEGRFNMALCIEKFAQHYHASFASRDLEFYERHGRLLFLSYLQPLINGKGFYHIESETRNTRRMDIVVDYGQDQFIIELKLWSGQVMHDKAYTQLLEYMDSKSATEGYLLTFDFRKDKKKAIHAQWVEFGEKRVYDVVV